MQAKSPQVVIVAGVHLLDSLPAEEKVTRLNQLCDQLKVVKKTSVIHLEIASVGDLSFLRLIAEKLLPMVDSIGLNEQELGSLYSCLGGKAHKMSDFVSPSLSVAVDAINYIFSLPFVKNENEPANSNVFSSAFPSEHYLQRIHLHFLSYHLIGLKLENEKLKDRFYSWDRARSGLAVAAGALATTIQACGTDGKFPPLEDVDFRFIPQSDSHFSEDHFIDHDLEYWVAPVAVCKRPIRTVG